ncbi:hypothetical protein DASB73_005350 [Starmerella bacillaris]|uniref:Uncharacterized protein n=1 Tax=Starmerella bacillaris TaxID=1247836 RepID=A0AAV5REC3_STABA|nr:hypothetical protein DASB73_005350 [Starmerella bacillaris]
MNRTKRVKFILPNKTTAYSARPMVSSENSKSKEFVMPPSALKKSSYNSRLLKDTQYQDNSYFNTKEAIEISNILNANLRSGTQVVSYMYNMVVNLVATSLTQIIYHLYVKHYFRSHNA